MNQPPRQPPPVQYPQYVQQPIYDAQPAQAMPVVISQPPSSGSLNTNTAQFAKIAADANLLVVVNNLWLGFAIGLLAAALLGPRFMVAPVASIGAGVALGGMGANIMKGNLASLVFTVLTVLSAGLALYGHNNMQDLQQLLR
jgi:hypothetical protein